MEDFGGKGKTWFYFHIKEAMKHFFIFLSSSLLVRLAHFKCGEMGNPRFELRTLDICSYQLSCTYMTTIKYF
jgi:hypothetical protein